MPVYVIENLINGKKYVGRTIRSIKKRFEKHINEAKNGSQTYLHNAIRKYGKENFSIYEVEAATTNDELNQKESYWISKLKTKKPFGYNLTDGGNGVSGFSLSAASRVKVSEGVKKYWNQHPELRESYSIKHKGINYHSPETISRITLKNTGKIVSSETRKKLSVANTGKKHLCPICDIDWVEVANKVLKKTGDDASAIKQANSVVKKMHESENYPSERKNRVDREMVKARQRFENDGRKATGDYGDV